MKIWTSSWSTAVPADILRVGISRGVPRHEPAGYRVFRRLAPGGWFQSVSADVYVRRYAREILAELDPTTTFEALKRLGDGRDIALLCFEPPMPTSPWCHRGLVSAWLHITIGLEVREFGQEHEGFGVAHPKMPPSLRGRALADTLRHPHNFR